MNQTFLKYLAVMILLSCGILFAINDKPAPKPQTDSSEKLAHATFAGGMLLVYGITF